MAKKSILSTAEQCWFCGKQHGLHTHHIYYGANRKISDKHGFTVRLCGCHHNLSNKSVHYNKEMDLELKKACQMAYEDAGHTREEFVRLIGKNYLD